MLSVSLMYLASAAAIAVAQLDSADVVIEIGETSAVVEARYRIIQNAKPVTFILIKLSGQDVQLEVVTTSSDVVEVDTLPGFYQLAVHTRDAAEQVVSVRYVVTGNLTRIPVLIPGVPTMPGVSGVRIRIYGIGPDASFRDAFPRLERAADGGVTAQPDNLPSFIRLPPVGGGWSTNRAAEAAVALLVLFATAFWLLRRRILVLGRPPA